MQDVIWLEESIDGTWDVFFDLLGELAPIGDIAVKEEDLKLIPTLKRIFLMNNFGVCLAKR